MNTDAGLPINSMEWRTDAMVLLVGAVSMVLASMDQCTRGPSLTAMVLSHINAFV